MELKVWNYDKKICLKCSPVYEKDNYQKKKKPKKPKALTFLKNAHKKIFIAFNVLSSQQNLHFILKKSDCLIFNEEFEVFLGRS